MMLSFKGKEFETFMWVKAVFCSFEKLAIPLWGWKISKYLYSTDEEGKG